VKLSLELNTQLVAAAVDVFILRKLDQLAREKYHQPEVRHTVFQQVKSNVKDTFLWVALLFQDLKESRTWHKLKKLVSFPPGLDSGTSG
jgi:hypothetical protein